MTEELDHGRVSELLAQFHAGDLDPRAAAAVERHLAKCGECRAEYAGLNRLVDGETARLSGDERARLHGRLEAELGLSPAADVIAPARRSWRARLAPALSAAAIVVVVVGGIAVGLRALDAERDAERGGADMGGAAMGGPGPMFEVADRGRGRTMAVEEEAATTDASPDDGGELAPASKPLSVRYSRLVSRPPFTTLGRAYTASDIEELQARFIVELQDQAPDGATRAQIEKCALEVIDASPNEVLPAYGALTRVERRPALVLGFVWDGDGRNGLERFMLWTWRRGDCAIPLDYETGIVPR